MGMLEEAAIAPQDLETGVTGQSLEVFRAVDYGHVRESGIAEDEGDGTVDVAYIDYWIGAHSYSDLWVEEDLISTVIFP